MLMLVCMTILSCPVLLYSRAVSRSAVVCSNSQTSLKELASTDSMANIASLSSVDEFHLENVASRRKGRAVTSHSNALWKEAIIPYKFHESVLADRKIKRAFTEAMTKWEQNTCIRFVSAGNSTLNRRYLLYTTAPGSECSTAVGRLAGGGPQEVRLGFNCTPLEGVAMHELGHSIGFWHEHTRPDRDRYVEILYSNIDEEYHSNFNIRQAEDIDSLGLPYDLDSIMHYSLDAFSNNQQNTIRVKVDFQGVVGQRLFLSDKDIQQANLLYKCQAMTKKRPLGCNGEISDGDTVGLRIQAVTGGLGHNWLRCKKKDNLHCRPSETTCAGYHFDNNDWKHCKHDMFRIFSVQANQDGAVHVGDTVVLTTATNSHRDRGCLTCTSGFKCKIIPCPNVFSNKSNVFTNMHFTIEAVDAKKGDVLKDQHVIGLRSTQDNNLMACKDNGRVPQCRRRGCEVDASDGVQPRSLSNCSDAQFVITKLVSQKVQVSSSNCEIRD